MINLTLTQLATCALIAGIVWFVAWASINDDFDNDKEDK
jgi:hypothetical protein